MLETLNKVREGILDMLMPRKCLGCGREGSYICQDCSVFPSEVNMVEASSQSGIMSVWEYEGIIERAILKIKHEGCYDIINELMEKVFEKIELTLPGDTVITYVPMYKKREKERGFNQARLIAEKIGKKTGKPVAGLLEKAKDGPSQTSLESQERFENVRNVFIAKSIGTQPQSVLLVDDICSTGSTLNECRKALENSGVKNVLAFTLAMQSKI
jgi:competence protein ComFC